MRKKEIDGRCLIGRRIHFDWNVYTLPMDNSLKRLFYRTEKPTETVCSVEVYLK